MVGASKILTVSYGTFSCTLEGFDDPFSTMKSIAEYFRDLAADDRYFGAEPPTPDAEMLHRIAEREIKRRVEARIDRDGVVLRQLAEADAAEVAGVSGLAGTPPSAADSMPEPSVAAQAEARADDLPPHPAPEASTTPAPKTEDQPAALREDDDIAAKLSRIRNVVAAEEPAGAGVPNAASPEPAPEPSPPQVEEVIEAAEAEQRKGPRVISLPLSAFAGMPVAFPGSETGADLPPEEPAPEDIRDLAELDGASDEDLAAAGEDLVSAEAPAFGMGDDFAFAGGVDDEDEDDEAFDDPSLDDAAFGGEAEVEDEDGEEEDFAASAEGDIEADDDAFDPAAFAAQFAPKPEPTRASLSADERALRHRVVSRDPFAEGADGDHIIRHTEEEFADDEASRRRSAIAHLRAAVAATKADKILRRVIGTEARTEDHAEEDPYRDDLAKVVKSRPVSHPRPEGAGSEPPLVLVSSLRVDRPAPEPEASDARDDATDHPENEEKASVAPRRVSADGENDDSGFEDFARHVGAEELPDLLEAAAAYASFVEGAPHFSRPQIMRQVAKIDPSVEVSREAGLRSFGQLLRQGRIHKLKRGQFTIAETTRFHPDSNRFAGE